MTDFFAPDVPVTAEGFAFDSATRDWTLRTEYVARNRQEALNWIRFNRDWMKGLRIVEVQS